jgi:Flp pilus assembly protein TadB
MAETKKRRKGKRRGTQGGSIDAKRRAARPRTREEAKARARSKPKAGQKQDLPPTWRSSLTRGLFAAAIFGVLLIVVFKRPLPASLLFAAFMLVFYVPAGYFIDMTLWRRRERQRMRSRS